MSIEARLEVVNKKLMWCCGNCGEPNLRHTQLDEAECGTCARTNRGHQPR